MALLSDLCGAHHFGNAKSSKIVHFVVKGQKGESRGLRSVVSNFVDQWDVKSYRRLVKPVRDHVD